VSKGRVEALLVKFMAADQHRNLIARTELFQANRASTALLWPSRLLLMHRWQGAGRCRQCVKEQTTTIAAHIRWLSRSLGRPIM
jgi:hypothetical protein